MNKAVKEENENAGHFWESNTGPLVSVIHDN